MLYDKRGETLEEVVPRSCGCLITGSVQGQAGRGFEHPGLAKAVPAHGRGWTGSSLKVPPNPNPSVTLRSVLKTWGIGALAPHSPACRRCLRLPSHLQAGDSP